MLAFYESDHISCLLSGKKDCAKIRLPDKTKTKVQKRLLLADISEIHISFKNEHRDKRLVFQPLHLYDPNGVSL